MIILLIKNAEFATHHDSVRSIQAQNLEHQNLPQPAHAMSQTVDQRIVLS
ncbi:MAG: hypothetical protein ACK53K_11265 [Burkholderiales bacterium]